MAWRTISYKSEFLVDPSHATELDLNVDLTVAMDCKYLRADVFDSMRASINVVDLLHAKPVHFSNKGAIELQQHMQDVLLDRDSSFQKRSFWQDEPQDGCRFHGTIPATKVGGMFHITSLGHGYFGEHTPHQFINFSHRIDELSFGREYPGQINPLDHTFELGTSHFDNFQYFLGVVPTIYIDRARSYVFDRIFLTNQYAVTEFFREIDESKPDAFPGIFIKYTVEPITVRVTGYRRGFLSFVTRLCGVVGGGAFATVGMVLKLFHSLASFFSRKKPL